MKTTKRLVPFILLFVLVCSTVFSSIALAATGVRTDPYSGYTKRDLSLQYYWGEPIKQIQFQLLQFIHGDEANRIVAEESEYNSTPASDEEWILLKYHLKYVSGPDESLNAYDVVNSYDSFYTTNSTAVTPIDMAWFDGDRAGLDDYDVQLYPGGESDVWYGMLVKKTVGYPLYRVATGYNEDTYTTTYTWFTTNPGTTSRTVTFNSQGGTVSPTSKAVISGSTCGTLPTPTKTGYTFGGWYTGTNGTGTKFAATTPVTANITVYAKWTANKYTITATANSMTYGTVSGGGSIAYGTSATVNATPKAGYRFVRWLEGTTAVSTAAEYKFTVTKARTLKAEFAKIGTPTVTAASAGYNSVKLTWAAVAGATKYEVYRAASSAGSYTKLTEITSTSYTNASLTTGTTYYYKVRVKCVAGTTTTTTTYGSYSAVVPAKPVPATPASVKAASASYNSVKLTWGAVTGAQGYEVSRYDAVTKQYKAIAKVTATSYINTGLTTGTTYNYKVRAYRLAGSTPIYSGYSAVVPGKPLPATPAGVAAARASATSIKVSWSAVTGAMGYEVSVATTSGGAYTPVKSVTTLSWTNTGLTTGKTYYYKVRAYRTVGSAKVFSGYSAVIYAKP